MNNVPSENAKFYGKQSGSALRTKSSAISQQIGSQTAMAPVNPLGSGNKRLFENEISRYQPLLSDGIANTKTLPLRANNAQLFASPKKRVVG